jgi:hypothetical protein
MNPNPHDLGRLTFSNSTRYQLRTLDCTYDGFCTGEGGPTIAPATNYIPEEKLIKKQKEKNHVRFMEEGFKGGRKESYDNHHTQDSGNASSKIPRATAESMAREHLTMRQKRK